MSNGCIKARLSPKPALIRYRKSFYSIDRNKTNFYSCDLSYDAVIMIVSDKV